MQETIDRLSRFASMGAVSATLPLAGLNGRGKDGAAHPPNPPYAPATKLSPFVEREQKDEEPR